MSYWLIQNPMLGMYQNWAVRSRTSSTQNGAWQCKELLAGSNHADTFTQHRWSPNTDLKSGMETRVSIPTGNLLPQVACRCYSAFLFFFSAFLIRKGAFSRPFCTVVHCNSSFLLTSTVFSSGHFTEFQSWCLLISCLWFLSPSWTLVLCTDRTLSSCIQSDSGLKACHRDLWRT